MDEISEMDLRIKAKLLRAIQEHEIDRIGGKRPVKIDVRILATSNRNMEQEVAEGRFREDLYFRLNVITIQIPNLADRPDDIEPLAKYFMEKYAAPNGLDGMRISKETLIQLKSHPGRGMFEN